MGGNAHSSLIGGTPLYFPTNASEWTINDLSALGISYHSSAKGLSEFMSLLIRESDQIALSTINLTGGHRFISTETPRCWTFSFQFDERVLQSNEEKSDNISTGRTGTIESLERLEERIQNCSNEGIR